jgi:serine/threonine-protein kinase RsbW
MSTLALFARPAYRAMSPAPRPSSPRDDVGEARVRVAADGQTVVQHVLGIMAKRGFGEPDLLAVRLALDEALSNALAHGNHGDAAKEVRVDYDVSDNRVLVQVEDQGDGFEPADVPDPTLAANQTRPSGRGIFLMRKFMTWVRFNAVGNCVTMCRLRDVKANKKS